MMYGTQAEKHGDDIVGTHGTRGPVPAQAPGREKLQLVPLLCNFIFLQLWALLGNCAVSSLHCRLRQNGTIWAKGDLRSGVAVDLAIRPPTVTISRHRGFDPWCRGQRGTAGEQKKDIRIRCQITIFFRHPSYPRVPKNNKLIKGKGSRSHFRVEDEWST